jgi:cleavage and polyadenylation specificity factor subunit 1
MDDDSNYSAKTLDFPKIRPIKDDNLTGTKTGRLELIAEYKLNGVVASMGIVQTISERGRNGCDSLLLAFMDAKVRLLDLYLATNRITLN